MPTKVRVIPTLLFKEIGCVKGVGFDSWRGVGSAMQAVKVYNMREVDELIFLDIAATQQARSTDLETVDQLSDECFMPLTVGGGVSSLDHVREILKIGADKIAINTAAVKNPYLIKEISDSFGSQCVVVSIDAKACPAGSHEVWTHSGTVPSGRDPISIAREAESFGAGEILLTSIDRDGTMKGYDLVLIRSITEAVSIPVIASGGVGNYQHMLEGLQMAKASAVAAASIFHFTHQTPLEAKKYLRENGINVRI